MNGASLVIDYEKKNAAIKNRFILKTKNGISMIFINLNEIFEVAFLPSNFVN